MAAQTSGAPPPGDGTSQRAQLGGQLDGGPPQRAGGLVERHLSHGVCRPLSMLPRLHYCACLCVSRVFSLLVLVTTAFTALGLARAGDSPHPVSTVRHKPAASTGAWEAANSKSRLCVVVPPRTRPPGHRGVQPGGTRPCAQRPPPAGAERGGSLLTAAVRLAYVLRGGLAGVLGGACSAAPPWVPPRRAGAPLYFGDLAQGAAELRPQLRRARAATCEPRAGLAGSETM